MDRFLVDPFEQTELYRPLDTLSTMSISSPGHKSSDIGTDNGYRYATFAETNNNTDLESSHNTPLPTAEVSSLSPGSDEVKKPSVRVLAPDLLRGLLTLLMAMDHCSIFLHTWRHGTNQDGESDGQIVTRWNRPEAYVVRTLTHLCGSGFTFLLGMGVVYLGRSRTKLGWSKLKLMRHFAVRGLVLTAVTVLLGLVFTGGQTWFMNLVLFELGADYFVAGILWIGINMLEKALESSVDYISSSKDNVGRAADRDTETPLLNHRTRLKDGTSFSQSFSWHLVNVLLLVLSVTTIFWNIWLSGNQGQCQYDSSVAAVLLSSSSIPSGPTVSHGDLSSWIRIWFWNVMNDRVMSNFPPLAWLSFAIFGLLYGRIMTARSWTPRASTLLQASMAIPFAIFFIFTRVFQFGNLSTGCLHTPDQAHYPDRNPYLASAASFFYVVKYPPDPAFWSITLAVNLLLLAMFNSIPVRITKHLTILLDFGTSALFFYVVHLFVLAAIAAPVNKIFGHPTGNLPPGGRPGDENADSRGIDNFAGYLAVWAVAMLIMWPMCRYWSRYKSRKSADSIWRFF